MGTVLTLADDLRALGAPAEIVSRAEALDAEVCRLRQIEAAARAVARLRKEYEPELRTLRTLTGESPP